VTRRVVSDHAAIEDLIDIWSFTAEKWGAAHADRYVETIERTTRQLARRPKRATPREALRPGYWSQRVGRHVVFFTFDESELRVRRVLHAAMDVPRHL
jgi:toxin ParE1/3/4